MGEPFNDDMWVNMYTKQVLWKLIAGQVLQGHLKKVGEVMETIWNDILFTFMDATSELKKQNKTVMITVVHWGKKQSWRCCLFGRMLHMAAMSSYIGTGSPQNHYEIHRTNDYPINFSQASSYNFSCFMTIMVHIGATNRQLVSNR